ncbi:hypothetical protein PENTCL1PPCAC_9157, partial [Pristionchus entomophagus]
KRNAPPTQSSLLDRRKEVTRVAPLHSVIYSRFRWMEEERKCVPSFRETVPVGATTEDRVDGRRHERTGRGDGRGRACEGGLAGATPSDVVVLRLLAERGVSSGAVSFAARAAAEERADGARGAGRSDRGDS